MTKKLTLLAMVAGALVAFAIPAMASASSLTQPAGTLVPVGSVVTAVSTNAKMKTSLGTLTCEKWTVNTQVTKNSGSGTVTAVQSGAGTTSVCKLGSSGLIFTNVKFNSLSVTSPTAGSANFSYEIDFSGLTCKYASTSGATPVTYTSGGSSIHVGGPLTATPASCGTSTFEADFALSRTASPVIID
jgi:hypothetical protein